MKKLRTLKRKIYFNGSDELLTAIILASGFSKRFNKNKLVTKINGKPLVEIILQEVCHSNFDEVILIYREEEIKKISLKYDVLTAYNEKANLGMSEAVKLGVNLANDKSDGYMFFMGDQPLIKADIINELIDEFYKDKDKILVPKCQGKRCNPVTFPERYKKDLLNLEGDIGGRKIIDSTKDEIKYTIIKDKYFNMDIDTIEDEKEVKNVIENE